jgi:hypothetical protein
MKLKTLALAVPAAAVESPPSGISPDTGESPPSGISPVSLPLVCVNSVTADLQGNVRSRRRPERERCAGPGCDEGARGPQESGHPTGVFLSGGYVLRLPRPAALGRIMLGHARAEDAREARLDAMTEWGWRRSGTMVS